MEKFSTDKLIAAGFGLLVSLFLFTAVEIGFRLLDPRPQFPEITVRPTYFACYDSETGVIEGKPGKYTAFEKRENTRALVYQVEYTFDNEGRRFTPLKNENPRGKFLIFLGDSFAFGEGVEDKETLPYYAGELLADVHPFNYAIPGTSTFDMLAKMDRVNLQSEIPEKEGAAIYVFIDAVMKRNLFSMRTIHYTQHNNFYRKTSDDSLLFARTFREARPQLTLFYKLFGKSRLLKFFHADIPPHISENDFQMTADLMEQTKKRFNEKYPAGKFLVLFFPGSEYSAKLIPLLHLKEIYSLDYSKLYDSHDAQYYLDSKDQHPNSHAYQLVAQNLAKNLIDQESFG